MPVLFGFRDRDEVIGFTVATTCPNCHNNNPFEVLRVTAILVLFIPLFPVSNDYYLSCPACGIGRRVTKKKAIAALVHRTI